MIQRVALIVGWAALVLITFATLSPIRGRPTLGGLQVEHFAAFAVMGFAFAFGLPRRALSVLAMMILSALVLEGAQLLTPDRHGRLIDALVKVIGGVCGGQRRPAGSELAASDRALRFDIREASSIAA
ncbi:VanZ family protein [Bradyrhizobium japonicum]|uniref:VanZ family protein n=1 Tax=Bradyrhizobium japonicum TaxID=375 RepID=UPI003399681F